MRERAQERTASRRRKRDGGAEDDERAVRAKIAAMHDADRAIAERVHAIIMETAPDLSPRLWYGMPAYAKDGKVVCYFQDAAKFKMRYATLGFGDKAKLDEKSMWPVAYALTQVTPQVEAAIAALVRKAVG